MSIRFGRSGNGYDSSQVMQTPDDDWRQITDVAERRRIQNRLAQRNYRRKLRNRLEELERQAGDVPATSTAQPSRKRTSRSPEHSRYREDQSQSRQTRARTEDVIEIPRTQQLSGSPLFASASAPTSAQVCESDLRMNSGDSHAFYAGDFGPLLSTRESQPRLAVSTAVPSHQRNGLDIWDDSSRSQSEARDSSMQPSSDDGHMPLTLHAKSPSSNTSPSESEAACVAGLADLLPACRQIPTVSSSYSASPLVNPDPLHLNHGIMPRDEFYITMSYNQHWRGFMNVSRVLDVGVDELMDDDAVSRISQSTVPEECEDLQPTERQLSVPHHPYIDCIPFPAFRDRLIDCTEHGTRTGDESLENRVCERMCESFGVWGATPWDSRSWEMSEDFAREFWYFLDKEMIRAANFWRRQRGLKGLNIPALKAGGWSAAARERGRIIGEVRG